jgi:hypothetical protein
MAPTYFKKQQKKGGGSWPLLKIGNDTHQTQNQNKKKNKNRVLTFKLVLPNFSLFQFQALHSSSSKFPEPKHSTYW